MLETQTDPFLDTLVNDFGANYTFAVDLLGQYRQDRRSVEPSWREYFDRLMGVEGPPPDGHAVTVTAQEAPAESTPRPTTLVRAEPAAPPAAREKSKALIVPALLPGDIAQPIRGGALRIVENMEASLTVPTATSVRTLPVRTLEENRAILNKHRAAT